MALEDKCTHHAEKMITHMRKKLLEQQEATMRVRDAETETLFSAMRPARLCRQTDLEQ